MFLFTIHSFWTGNIFILNTNLNHLLFKFILLSDSAFWILSPSWRYSKCLLVKTIRRSLKLLLNSTRGVSIQWYIGLSSGCWLAPEVNCSSIQLVDIFLHTQPAHTVTAILWCHFIHEWQLYTRNTGSTTTHHRQAYVMTPQHHHHSCP